MIFTSKDVPLEASFDDTAYQDIFLNNRYPGAKATQAAKANFIDKAEIWALFDAPVRYNGINMLRELRSLWGIHLTLKIGPRSQANAAVRGSCKSGSARTSSEIFFEGYSGNISDATRDIVAFAPYDSAEKSRALSQKFFVRILVPLRSLPSIAKVDAIMLAYALGSSLDRKRFAGIVDPDIFLFAPPSALRAGLAAYHRDERLLNTHLVYGFNFFETDGKAQFFSHGLNRYGFADLVLPGESKADYSKALRAVHEFFLKQITQSAKKLKLPTLRDREKLPEQVRAMVGKNVAAVRFRPDQK